MAGWGGWHGAGDAGVADLSGGLMAEDNGQLARIIPTSALNGTHEAERRAPPAPPSTAATTTMRSRPATSGCVTCSDRSPPRTTWADARQSAAQEWQAGAVGTARVTPASPTYLGDSWPRTTGSWHASSRPAASTAPTRPNGGPPPRCWR